MAIDFGAKDVVDILLVAYLLYKLYKLMKESGSLNLFVGVLVFLFIGVIVSHVLDMRLLGSIFEMLQSVGLIAIIVLFQEEIRRFLLTLGSQHRAEGILKFLGIKRNETVDHSDILPIVMACLNMSKQRIGALIVIERDISLRDVINTGDVIDANINQRLIENIFFKNSPLHDGAMVISRGRIQAAGCILPVSHDQNIPRHLGLRHRSALGMTQFSDALVIIVSEESGAISTAYNGQFNLRLTPEELESILVDVVR